MPPNPTLTPPSPTIADLRTLWPFLRRERGLFSAWVIAMGCASIATLMLPIAVRLTLDEGFTDTAMVDRSFLWMLVAIVLSTGARAAQFLLISLLGERVVADLRSRLYGKLISLDVAFHDQNRSSELISRLAVDAELLRNVVAVSLPSAIGSTIAFIGSAVMLASTDLRLAAWASLVLPLTALPILMNGKHLAMVARTAQDRLGDANALAAEALGAVVTVRSHARESHERHRYASALKRAVKAADHRIAIQALITFTAIALVFGVLLLVLWQCAKSMQTNGLTPGELGQFMVYAAICAMAFGDFAEIWNDVQRAAGGMGRIEELLSATPTIPVPSQPVALPQPMHGEIHFNTVGFHYPQRTDCSVLEAFDLRLEPGETVALVGPSGAGKSTVLSLLLRHYDPVTGSVSVDGIDLRNIDPSTWRTAVAVVSQAPTLFATTVLDNVRYGRLDATEREVEAALQAAQAFDFVSELPQGMHTQIGERGAMLSGGQIQRLAIARALLRNAPVLLLDEATSALDAQSEQAIQRALDVLMRNRTTLVIAHRLSTVQKADRIVVVDQGKIIAQGTHAQLLMECGLYAELAKLQLLPLPELPLTDVC